MRVRGYLGLSAKPHTMVRQVNGFHLASHRFSGFNKTPDHSVLGPLEVDWAVGLLELWGLKRRAGSGRLGRALTGAICTKS